MHYLPYIFGIIIILVGIKTVFTQEATLTIQLWGNDSTPPQNQNGVSRGYSTSEHTGFIAVLIGISQIAIGVAMLIKGPAFLSWL